MNNEYSTKDLHFAAFLKLSGAEITRLERRETIGDYRRPVYFIFSDRDKCMHLESIYWTGEGDEIMVNAKQFVNEVRDLRIRTSTVNNVVEERQS